MSRIRAFIRPAAVALAFCFSATPLTAYADAAASRSEVREGKQFPMKAESFQEMVERRIRHGRERLSTMLVKHKVPEAIQSQIKKDFEDGAAAVRALSARVQADGTVTKDEARQVRELAKELKQKAREKYHLGKGKKAHRTS